MTLGRLLSSLSFITFALSACTSQSVSDEPTVNQTALAAELLKAAGGDLRIVEASGGDVAKAKLLAAGKKLAEPTPTTEPSPSTSTPTQNVSCWTPPSGPNIIDDPDRPIRVDELQEIQMATGREYVHGDTVWGRAEDRCPA